MPSQMRAVPDRGWALGAWCVHCQQTKDQRIAMLQSSLQTNPLFVNSLRSWQAAWRAEKGLTSAPQAPVASESAAIATAPVRRTRRVVRPRRGQQTKLEA